MPVSSRRHHEVRPPPAPRGVSILEVLVAIMLVGVLIALAAPIVAAARNRARQGVSLVNIRTLGSLVLHYAADNKDLPPVLFRPIEAYFPPVAETLQVNGRPLAGFWFDNASSFHYAIQPWIPAKVLLAPGAGEYPPARVVGTATVDYTDYVLARCLYASPSYWNRWTQRGASQWGPQILSRVTFPAEKGLMRQFAVYGVPGFPHRQQASHFANVPSAVLWADLSATITIQANLNPGEPDFYYHYPAAKPTYLDDGTPIDTTLDGVNGRDRGSYPGRPVRN